MSPLKSYGSQWFSTIAVAGISVLLTFFLGRLLGPQGFGAYNYLLTIASFCAIFQDGGFRILIYREISSPTFKDITHKLISIALGQNILVTFIGIVLVLVFPFDYKFILILSIISFGLGATTAFFSSQIKGEGQFDVDARWKILVRTLTATSILVFLFLKEPTLQWVFIGTISGYCIALACRPTKCSLNFQLKKLDYKVYKSLAALLLIDIGTLIYFKIDLLMLRHLGPGLDEIGYYAAASRIVEGLIFLHLPLATVLFRELRTRAEKNKNFLTFVFRCFLVGVLPPLIILPIGWIFSADILSLCFGPDYQHSYPVLNLLLIALIFMIPNLVLTQSTIASNQEYFYAIGTLLAAALNITLNFYFIPAYGTEGAVYGTIATEAFLMIYIGSGVILNQRKKKIS